MMRDYMKNVMMMQTYIENMEKVSKINQINKKFEN